MVIRECNTDNIQFKKWVVERRNNMTKRKLLNYFVNNFSYGCYVSMYTCEVNVQN